MKKIVIILIALLLLGGGGFGAYTFFNQKAEASETVGPETEDKTAEAHGETVPPVFVELKPLVLPVLDDHGVSQIISIVISLEADGPEKAAEIENLKPRLTDAYIQGMYGVLSTKSIMDGGVLQVGTIKAKLGKITNKVLGENQVKDVLLQVVQQRHV